MPGDIADLQLATLVRSKVMDSKLQTVDTLSYTADELVISCDHDIQPDVCTIEYTCGYGRQLSVQTSSFVEPPKRPESRGKLLEE